jgi:solute carrier family 25 phosphate transporter 23/24/25/41
MNFAAYEFLKTLVPKKEGSSDPPVTLKLLCGGIAGAIGQTVAYPLDVVRRQMQAQGFADGHNSIHKGTWKALVTIKQKDGVIGLFRGLSINYLKVMPQVAISFTTYEHVKKMLSTISTS